MFEVDFLIVEVVVGVFVLEFFVGLGVGVGVVVVDV